MKSKLVYFFTESAFVWVYLLVAALVFLASMEARASFKPTPLPYSCDTVRLAFKIFTREHLEKMAVSMGIHVTAAQRAQVGRCLKGGN